MLDPRFSKMHSQSGFSALELLVCVTVIALLLSVSVPVFSELVSRNKIAAQANVLRSSLALAREAAIAQATIVLVCQRTSPDLQRCSQRRQAGADWSSGWIVFADRDANNELGPTDLLLSASDQLDGSHIIFNQRGRLRFFPDGTARSAGFYLCDPQNTQFRHLRILHSGRIRLTALDDQQKKTRCLQSGSSS